MDDATLKLQDELNQANACTEHWRKAAAQSTEPQLKADALGLADYHHWLAKSKKAKIELALLTESLLANRRLDAGTRSIATAPFEEDVDRFEKERDGRQKLCDTIVARMAPREAEQAAVSGPKADHADQTPRELWRGTLREFVDSVIAQWRKGLITADTERQAVLTAAGQHDWVKKGVRQPMSGKNAWQCWANRR